MTVKTILTPSQIRAFQKKIHHHYRDHGRNLPWRRTRKPYRILISEIMLQQTQVERVLEKYKDFLAAFPDLSALAKAPLAKLLRVWQGMGYNRRALALKALARTVVHDHGGKLPDDPAVLVTLPGIGPYTAGAVAAFAFNRPVVFLDTNIRRVFIHEFLHDRTAVRDTELIPLIEQALDRKDPRTWYNALMDYGAMLKREHGNPNRRSAHYTRQSPFENSDRQVRGLILKALVKKSPLTQAGIVRETGVDPKRVKQNLARLESEGFIRKKGRAFVIGQ